MHPIHHWEEILEKLEHARPRRDDQKRRKTEKEDGKHEFHSDFASAFFRLLAPPNTQEIRLRA